VGNVLFVQKGMPSVLLFQLRQLVDRMRVLGTSAISFTAQGSRVVETRRFQAMGHLDSTLTQPHRGHRQEGDGGEEAPWRRHDACVRGARATSDRSFFSKDKNQNQPKFHREPPVAAFESYLPRKREFPLYISPQSRTRRRRHRPHCVRHTVHTTTSEERDATGVACGAVEVWGRREKKDFWKRGKNCRSQRETNDGRCGELEGVRLRHGGRARRVRRRVRTAVQERHDGDGGDALRRGHRGARLRTLQYPSPQQLLK
jgi:hypothetical protein